MLALSTEVVSNVRSKTHEQKLMFSRTKISARTPETKKN